MFFAVPASAQESLLDVVLKRDKLIVATYSTSPPLAYVDDNGKLVGFEVKSAGCWINAIGAQWPQGHCGRQSLCRFPLGLP